MRFGGIVALDDVAFRVPPNEVFALIGPNGAGKTTAINVITGFVSPNGGQVCVNGKSLIGKRPEAIAKAGVVRTFQATRLFNELTVLENVEVSGIGAGRSRGEARRRALSLLQWLDFSGDLNRPAGVLPHGDQQRVGIARALAMAPRYLLLDEPAAGMNDDECDQLVSLIVRIPSEFDCGVLLVEHNMSVVMGASNRVHVLNEGRFLAEGDPDEIQSNAEVRRAYLGDRTVVGRSGHFATAGAASAGTSTD